MIQKALTSTLKKIVLRVGYTIFGLFVFLVALGLWLSDAPETHVQAGNRIPAEFVQTAREVDALGRGEKAVFFYAPGLEMRDEFVILTDSRIARYGKRFEPSLSHVLYREVSDINLSRDTDFAGDSSIELELLDGGHFTFVIASEDDGDLRVHDYVVQQVELARAQQEEMANRLQAAKAVEAQREAEAELTEKTEAVDK